MADLYFGHQHIPQVQQNRPFTEAIDITAHDQWLLELWNTTVGKKDIVYILGDRTFFGHNETRRLLENLSGRNHLILGNHDKSEVNLTNYFMTVSPLGDIVIKPTSCSTLRDNLHLMPCQFRWSVGTGSRTTQSCCTATATAESTSLTPNARSCASMQALNKATHR